MNDSTSTPSRNSSFELLRLILMFMIIVHHSIVHGLGLINYGDANSNYYFYDTELPILCIINSFCICAVNCFVLISGYFSIKISAIKFFKLIFTLLFYTILLNSLPALISGNYKLAISSLLIMSHSPYWFVIDYIFLMAFAPLFNNLFKSTNRKYVIFLIFSMLIISCYFGFIWSHRANDDGYTLFQFFLMYCIGRYISINNISLRSSKAAFSYILLSLVIGILMCLLYLIGYSTYAWRLTWYNNPLLITSSICLFLLFKNINIHNRLINRLALSSFAIYLVQSSRFGEKIYYSFLQKFTIDHPSHIGG